MEENLEISDKERRRREKISIARKKYIKKKREKGYREYLKRKRKEIAKREREKQREKERKKREVEKRKHKRPVGRPKKRGPKKKYKRKVPKFDRRHISRKLPPFVYKIISCKNGKQNKLIGKYRTVEEAYDVFNKLKDENKNIIFPIFSYGNDCLKNSIDEYVLIEKNDTKDSSMLRNEYGVIVEHKTNIDGWIVLDKARYYKEEKFWVWGHDNKSDRKTFMWVFDNLLLNGFSNNIENKFVCTYKNKVVIKSDGDGMEIIFCKNIDDSIRFYNLLEKYSKKNKLKRAIFIGDFSKFSEKRRKLEQEMVEYTGMTLRKIRMKNTSFFLTNK